MRIGIYFGSSTGTTEDIAGRIAAQLGVDSNDIHNVSSADPNSAAQYDLLILGTSTWGVGDLQDDWADFKDGLKPYVSGKKVALFGVGDSDSFGDTFCDGVGELYETYEGAGCTFVGEVSADGYTYGETRAERDGHLVGLLLDEANQSDLTDSRIAEWVKTLK